MLSTRTPHEWAPDDTELKTPEGAPIWRRDRLPQQTRVLSSLSPHAWDSPTDTALNEPDGALAILPQHLTVPSARSPHIVELPEDDAPLEMALKIPVAGSDCKKSLLPQQAIVPSVLSPHAWDSPTDTALNEPDGALVILPQHLTVPPACSPQE